MIEYGGVDLATSRGKEVISGTAGNDDGAYYELMPTTLRENHRVRLTVQATHPDAGCEVVIAVGPLNSEVDQFSVNFWTNSSGVIPYTTPSHMPIPFTIAAGSRITAKIISTDANVALRVSIMLSDDDSWGTSTEATLLGSTGGDGVVVDPGAVANTKPTGWTTIIESTPHDINYLMLCVGQNNNNNISGVHYQFIDIAKGIVSSEVPVFENVMHFLNGSEIGNTWYADFVDNIPAGTRISARMQSDVVLDANDRKVDICVLGVRVIAPAGGGGGSIQTYGAYVG
jgi:hypothetical protein